MSKFGWFATIFLVVGIGWAAYDDLSKKDEEWIADDCNPGIESTIHQKDDGSWIIGVRSDYSEKLSVVVRIQSPKDTLIQAERLRPAEEIFLDGSKLKDPENAKVLLGPVMTIDENDSLDGFLMCEKYINKNK